MKRKKRIDGVLLIVVLITVLSLLSFLLILSSESVRLSPLHRPPATASAGVSHTLSRKHITKSLSQLRSSFPATMDHVLFFNRVPKTGSEMLVLLLQWLQGANEFRHIRMNSRNSKRKLNRMEQEEFVEKVNRIIRDEAIPLTFDQHVYFVNFSRFDRQSPTYINLIRDPVEKAVSRFYYKRVTPNPRNPDMKFAPKRDIIESWKNFEDCVDAKDKECTFLNGQLYDLSIPYFCGHEDWCMKLNNKYALEQAKSNVEQYFSVVGVLEELNATLNVLENTLPRFFKGITKLYFEELLEPHKNHNRNRPRKLREDIRSKLEESLRIEYEFYYWIKSRLLSQSYSTTSKKNMKYLSLNDISTLHNKQ